MGNEEETDNVVIRFVGKETTFFLLGNGVGGWLGK